MKWFDTKDIKGEETLTPEQISYLRKPSVSIMGPFNVIVRKHWDLLVVLAVLSIGTSLVLGAIFGFETAGKEPLNSLSDLVELPILWFAIVHGRRLAWNRNQWKSFEDLQASEKRWIPWGWIVIALWVVSLAYSLYTAL